jgi:hypothetical protein
MIDRHQNRHQSLADLLRRSRLPALSYAATMRLTRG